MVGARRPWQDTPVFGRRRSTAVIAWAASLLVCVITGPVRACPRAPIRLAAAGFALAPDGAPLTDATPLVPVRLPDDWRTRLPTAGGLGWYRFTIPAGPGDDAPCAIYVPEVNMNAAVYVDGRWIGEGGAMTEPVAHNFNRPLYFEFPGSLLSAAGGHVDVLVYGYAHHFGRLAPIWVGPHPALWARYLRSYFRRITLAQIGTTMAIVTALGMLMLWLSTTREPLYGFFFVSTAAWTINSLNYWVSAIPVSHWTWDRLVNGALDQFAVFLALFFHRVLRVQRPRVELLLWGFAAVAALVALMTPPPLFADAMMVTHSAITIIGLYVTVLSWTYRDRLSPLEARVYLGAWLLQLLFSAHDLGLQLGLWRGLGYTLPYTVSCMLVAFGTTLGLRFVRALRTALALNEELEHRVQAREAELSQQFARSRDLERRHILIGERQRLMREMHDGLGAQLISVLALVESDDHGDPGVVTAVRESLDELRLVILSLDPGFTEVGALLAGLRARLEQTLERRGIRFRWRVGDTPTPAQFGPEQLQSLLRILQEAITNAVRHASPHAIEVATAVDDGQLVITVVDDGVGFPEPVQPGRGLEHMRRRAAELGGACELSSGRDGTRIVVRVPLGSPARVTS